ncbi:MAG: leucine-rich repeat domain-containing protein [Pseudomonadota bacterium]
MVDSGSEILGYFTNRIMAAKEQQLTELDLSVPFYKNSDNKLDNIPASVFELTYLEKLNLHNNAIKKIPESISKLTNLTHLYLSAILLWFLVNQKS